MKVLYGGESYPCDRAVKGADYIELYNGADKGVCFYGIVDFSGYSIEGGTWSAPAVSADTLQAAQIQALADRNEFLEDCIAEMAGIVYGG